MPAVDPYRAYNFKLEIQGVVEGHFTECDGLSVKVHSLAYREGGASQVTRRLPGPVEYSDVTLRYGLTASRELWDWFMSAVKGAVERKNVGERCPADTGDRTHSRERRRLPESR